MSDRRLKVAIAGASGFVGRSLIAALETDFDIIGLSRQARENDGAVEWRACDLFSLLQAEEAIEGADLAIFLVHSMLPSSRLTQGSFEDLDAIVADNFSRACSRAGVKQIIYLGGLIEDQSKDLSRHLESRKELERILAGSSAQLTTLRAGLIVGPGGSSYLMLVKLVLRLPVMVLPRWTETKTQPVDLRDVVKSIRFCLNRAECFDQSFDLGGPEVMTYSEMIQKTAELNHRSPVLLRAPFFSPKLSTFWVSLVTGAPSSLVAPLVESLIHRMTAKNLRLFKMAGIQAHHFEDSVRYTIETTKKSKRVVNRLKEMRLARSKNKSLSLVRSVQRLVLPPGMRAVDVMDEYVRWLPNFFKFIIRVDVDETGFCDFRFSLLSLSLLRLEIDYERTTADRPLMRIKGGVLAHKGDNGRLEFRELTGRKFVMTAIHNYRPRLPWFIYNQTQARVHLWVMNQFGKHLKKRAERSKKAELPQEHSQDG